MSDLTPATRQQILTALAALPATDSAAGRDMLLRDLPPALRDGIRRDTAKATDLAAVVTACEAWPPPPGQPSALTLLLDAAVATAAGSSTATTLYTLRAAIGGGPSPGPNPYRSLAA